MPEMVQITGRVADVSSGMVVPGVRVEAWDDEGAGHRVLASADTDGAGAFSLQFARPYEDAMLGLPRIDVEGPGEELPDESPPPMPPRAERPVYLKVLRAGAVLAASGARWDGRPEVALMVDAGAERPAPPPPGRPGPIADRTPSSRSPS